MSDHATYMRRAIEIAGRALDEPGAMPYGAVVVKDGRIVGEGLNRSAALYDPTSHGEVEAVRDACRKLGTTWLDGAVVYTSCEPCAMCVATMYMAGISGIYYANTIAESGAMWQQLIALDPKSWVRRTDANEVRRETGLPIDQRRMRAERILAAEGQAVLDGFVDSVAKRS
jgi:guanine deaminase